MVETVERTRKWFVEAGLDAALTKKPRPGAKPVLGAKGEAHLVALDAAIRRMSIGSGRCSRLADRMVELNYVDSISVEAIRRRF